MKIPESIIIDSLVKWGFFSQKDYKTRKKAFTALLERYPRLALHENACSFCSFQLDKGFCKTCILYEGGTCCDDYYKKWADTFKAEYARQVKKYIIKKLKNHELEILPERK